MYPRFIEVHDVKVPQCEIMINIDAISCVYVDSRGVTIIKMDYLDNILIEESYDELNQLIQNAGASISKGDPRLDTVHPLTIADLQGMLGEPVWNSNLMRWGLVKEITEDTAVLVYQAADWVIVDANDLVKFPLYRMKQ